MPDHVLARRLLFLALCPLLLLLSCSRPAGDGEDTTPTPLAGVPGPAQAAGDVSAATLVPDASPAPLLDLTLSPGDVTIDPLPVRAGQPFTVTAVVHNRGPIPAVGVPLTLHVLAEQEKVGYAPFLATIAASVPPSQSVPIDIPVRWNLAGGRHQVWVEVNRRPPPSLTPGVGPETDRSSIKPESRLHDNAALLEVQVEPFDAYTSDLCRGRVDVEISPAGVLRDLDPQRIRVQVHNVGNRAVYNLPVVVLGQGTAGIAYTPAIAPCGGAAEILVGLDRPLEEGEPLTVQVNPRDWIDGLPEDDYENNSVTLSAGVPSATELASDGSLDEYDFRLQPGDVQAPEPGIVEVTVHNLGTRDAAGVPIRIENQAGRKLVDVIPLVRGEGLGVAAFRLGYLWTRGGTLTITVNPPDAPGAYPETHHADNTAHFTLP